MSQTDHYRVVVIGGGPGGYAAAFLAADLGMRVALIDPDENPGGVCLYRGCIPSKALLHVAKLLHETSEAETMGLTFSKPKIDLDRMRAWKNEVVAKMTGGLGVLAKQRKVTHIRGMASFADASNLRVELTDGGTDKISFDYAIIATGSHITKIPAFEVDENRVLDSTSALDIESVPKSLLVVGGGYIGLELGSVYAALGSKVSVVEMMPGLVTGADRDLVRVLQQRLDKSFEDIMVETKVTGMSATKKGIEVSFEGKNAPKASVTYDKVLVSIGRKPNSKGIGLENTGIRVDDQGFIVVNEQRQTAEPNVYAIGDVTGQPMLAHKASAEARVAVETIHGEKVAFEPAAIPAVMFTDPELAWCGLTETEAKAKGIDVAVAKFPWGASGRATTVERNDGLTKLIIDPKTERVLGMGMVGVGAGEMIAEGVVAVEMAALASDVKMSIHPHPTLSETIMEAAEVFYGQSTHVYRPKRR